MNFKEKFDTLRKNRNFLKVAKDFPFNTFEAQIFKRNSFLELGREKNQSTSEDISTTEKTKTLKSLETFAHEKIEKSEKPEIKFKGLEIKKKKDNALESFEVDPKTDGSTHLIDNNGEFEVLFVYEASKLDEDQKIKSRELLEKMIQAMKLEDSNFHIAEFSKEELELESFKSNIFSDCYLSKTKVLVSFGAVATNILLGRKERLTRVHGNFFKKVLSHNDDQLEVQIVPIFHPDFLLINPNMKRSAWVDLQEVMKFLGVIPS